MSNPSICRSCSGPLSEYKPEEIVREGFCPYCVDSKGIPKSYDEVLKGMLAYIRSDHPEIATEAQQSTAEKWLLEGNYWGQVFSGVIIEESLTSKEVLNLCKIVNTAIEKMDNFEKNNQEPQWTLHTVEVPRAKIEEVVELLKNTLKLPNWWADLSYKDEVFIIFKDKIFNGSKNDHTFVKLVRDYGHALKLPQSQIPLS